METTDLKLLAERSRFMREAGIAILLASLVLAVFLFIPFSPEEHQTASAASALATTTDPAAFENLPIQGKAAIVYDLTDDQILYQQNADAQLPLASLTKLLTVYTALETIGSDATVTIPADAVGLSAPESFKAGEQFTLSDLARITLTGSLNDGAQSIAENAAQAEGTTVSALLDGEATKLGLSATYAINGSGLDVNSTLSGGYGSAYDIAVLAGDLLRAAPDIVLATTQPSATATSLAGVVHTAKNTDLDAGLYPRLLLSKTGYTDLAGGNLCIIFDAGIDHPIAIVVLGSTEDARFTDGDTLVGATLAYFANQPSI